MPRLPCKFQLGAVVYHRMDGDGTAGLVVNVLFNGGGGVTYRVAWGHACERDHYEIELSTVRTCTPEADDSSGGIITDNE